MTTKIKIDGIARIRRENGSSFDVSNEVVELGSNDEIVSDGPVALKLVSK